MGVIFPDNSNEVTNRIQTDVKGELENSNPWLRSSFLRSLAVGLGNRVFDYYYQVREALNESFPATATGIYLDFWAFLRNLVRKTATPGAGLVTFTGSLASTVPAGQVLTVGSLEYELQSDVTLATILRNVSSLSAVGTTALCVTTEDHNFVTGAFVAIGGANESQWNNVWEITSITATNEFTFEVPLGITSPATGTIEADIFGASGTVECNENGSGTNQDGGVELELQTPVIGVDDVAIAQFEGIQGGFDDESEEEYQDRVVDRWRNPETPFNPQKIESTIKKISGNTRVWVHRTTPAVGQVTAYFVRDNDDSIIPSTTEVDTAKAAVVDIAGAERDERDIIIEAPTAIPIDITLDNISPDSISMRQAIEDQIRSFYRGSLDEGETHRVDKLKSQLEQTYDVQAGRALESYTLVQPTGDTNVNMGEIAVEGNTVINN